MAKVYKDCIDPEWGVAPWSAEEFEEAEGPDEPEGISSGGSAGSTAPDQDRERALRQAMAERVRAWTDEDWADVMDRVERLMAESEAR